MSQQLLSQANTERLNALGMIEQAETAYEQGLLEVAASCVEEAIRHNAKSQRYFQLAELHLETEQARMRYTC